MKKAKSKSIVLKILECALVLIMLIFGISLFFLAKDISEVKKDIINIEVELSNINNICTSDSEDEMFYERYLALSEKADIEMDKLVTTVGLLATVYTIFGALIVFRAPSEIDKKINNLQEIVSDAKFSAEEAEYQAEIVNAVVNGLNGEMTNYDKIQNISEVIKKYPTKPDAYFQRAMLFDNIKKYENAIQDYKTGHRYEEVKKSPYYNNIGITYEKMGDNSKALSHYSKAIKITPIEPAYYTNRAKCYLDQKKFDLAINDFNKAIELDETYKEAYIGRSTAYYELMEENPTKSEEYYNLQVSDLNKALDLDPEDKNIKKLLLIRNKTKTNLGEFIAQLDEKIGDLELKENHCFEAFKQYIDACKYYLFSIFNRKEGFEKASEIIEKIHNIDNIDISNKIDTIKTEVQKFCCLLRVGAVEFYTNGFKKAAEQSFLILIEYDNDNESAMLNLAFMKRRGETCITTQTTDYLLDCYTNKGDALWCVNKALCFVSGAENHERDWDKAINVLENATENFENAVEWWDNVSVVGEKENNIVELMLSYVDKFGVVDFKSREARIEQAKNDGYVTPETEEIS